ncbi:hypothetical protein A8C75_13905 [Marinobacterium aestuarii]|uniref:Uncharacterized protein n=1 Tax=Marinobacterium aestuarii TaxID=1821621 RepID=A0A1A9EZY4_9GAMM|nr:hypothetical protein A8C75_13905 [Marinobacterium aestuarii]
MPAFDTIMELEERMVELIDRALIDEEIAANEELNAYLQQVGVQIKLEKRDGKMGLACGQYWGRLAGRDSFAVYEDAEVEEIGRFVKSDEGSEDVGIGYVWRWRLS